MSDLDKILDFIANGHIKGEVGKKEVHGMRLSNNGDLQVKNFKGEWVDAATGTGIPPTSTRQLRVSSGNKLTRITFEDGGDTVIDGKTVAKWAGTKIVRKAGDVPRNPKDGVEVLNNKTRNKYSATPFVDGGLNNGTKYYYGVFPYSTEKNFNVTKDNIVEVTPESTKVMTVRIDTQNSNPESALIYMDDAVEMKQGSDKWDEFFGIYPVLLKKGEEVGKLNPNDFSKFANGKPADITSGNSGDVMICFPRMGFKLTNSGRYLYVSITDAPYKLGFCYKAHEYGSENLDRFYLGAYKGYVSIDRLRSLSGKSPTCDNSIEDFRSYAHSNGSGYEQSGWYQLILRQCMYILKYKNLDSQSAVGMGFTGGSNKINTGGVNAKGMCFGSSSATTQVKVFGIEDFWGNVYEWIDGINFNGSSVYTSTHNFQSDTSSGSYSEQGEKVQSDGHTSKAIGGECGFLPSSTNGSDSTYYCDKYWCSSDWRVLSFGGDWGYGSDAGAFFLRSDYSSGSRGSSRGARLMYFPIKED